MYIKREKQILFPFAYNIVAPDVWSAPKVRPGYPSNQLPALVLAQEFYANHTAGYAVEAQILLLV